MPEMDGLQNTRAIHREWPRQQYSRIITMTADAMKQDREIRLVAGIDDYLSNPIGIGVEELIGALSKCHPLDN